MKIYKIALSFEDANRVNQREDLAFDDIFGNNLRVVIPLQNEKLFEIVELLEAGDTESGLSYKIDIDRQVVYRIKDNQIDPRPIRAGKAIKRELGQDWADEWSRQVNSTASSDYSIVVSRSPIDIARMSDHYKIKSCHTPGGSYYTHALEEAIEGGAIAYVVENDEINNIVNANRLQSTEIFTDSKRGVEGISPLSRIRINRYEEGDDSNNEIALPTIKMYGDDVAGFLPSLTKWLYNQQQEKFESKDFSINDYVRTGGSYADASDNKLIKNMFGSDMGVQGDLEVRSGETRAEIYNDELSDMMNTWNNKLNYSNVYADAEMTDEYLRISAGADLVMDIYAKSLDCTIGFGEGVKEGVTMAEKAIRTKAHDLNLPGYIEDIVLDYDVNTGITKIIFRIYLDDSGDISNPDDFNYACQALETFEGNGYNELLNFTVEILGQVGLIQRTKLDYNTHPKNFDDFFQNIGMDYNQDGEITMSFPFPFDMKAYYPYSQHMGGRKIDTEDEIYTKLSDSLGGDIREALKVGIENSFRKFLPLRMADYIKNISRQKEFSFEDKETSIWEKEILVPFFEVYLHNWDEGFNIDIPHNAIIKMGLNYFQIFSKVLPYVIQDVMSAIQPQIEKVNREYGHLFMEKQTKDILEETTALSWYSIFKIGECLKNNRKILHKKEV